ncbi:MAG TPA: hypothetical protein VJM50_09380 [Pyrinomonadaceae bacterium]|nr:hypothetical protein [Pyrinomonadaceae bacterium]
MATYTPPPYFPQGSLAPPDKRRYRKFKLLMALLGLVVVGLIASAGYGIWYLFSRVIF